METIQPIWLGNQLTGCFLMAILTLNGLRGWQSTEAQSSQENTWVGVSF